MLDNDPGIRQDTLVSFFVLLNASPLLRRDNDTTCSKCIISRV